MIEAPPSFPETEIPRYSVEEIVIAGDKGPCGGVNMAIETTFEVLGIVAGRENVYTNNQPVHNTLIMTEFGDKLVIEKDVESIPDGSILVASAHGWSDQDKKRAGEKSLLVVDETCQFVSKVKRAAARAVAQGKHVLYLGASNHPEPIGILGGLPEDSYTFIDIETPNPFLLKTMALKRERGELEIVTLNQTTLSTKGVIEIVGELRELNPDLEIPDPTGLCYATDNRQKSVRDRILGPQEEPVDMLLVIGSQNSHNSGEIKNVGLLEAGIPSYLIDSPEEIDPRWFKENIRRIMISSGASVLSEYLQRIVEYFRFRGTKITELEGTERDLTFVAPDLQAVWQRYAPTAQT